MIGPKYQYYLYIVRTYCENYDIILMALPRLDLDIIEESGRICNTDKRIQDMKNIILCISYDLCHSVRLHSFNTYVNECPT